MNSATLKPGGPSPSCLDVFVEGPDGELGLGNQVFALLDGLAQRRNGIRGFNQDCSGLEPKLFRFLAKAYGGKFVLHVPEILRFAGRREQATLCASQSI